MGFPGVAKNIRGGTFLYKNALKTSPTFLKLPISNFKHSPGSNFRPRGHPSIAASLNKSDDTKMTKTVKPSPAEFSQTFINKYRQQSLTSDVDARRKKS